MAVIDKSKGQFDRWLVAEDEKNRALPLRQMQLVPPDVGIFDEPTRCYRINHEWAKIVMGMVSWLAEIAPWRDAENEGYVAILEIIRFLAGGNCMTFELRQSPTDPCLLEQTLDGGETWIPAYDFTLCEGLGSLAIQNQLTIQNIQQGAEQQLQDAYQNYLNNYINSVTDLYPNLGYDASQDDGDRDRALCYALKVYVDGQCDAAIAYFDQITQSGAELSAQLALVLAAAALATLLTFGAAAPLALAVTTASIGLGAAAANALVKQFANSNREAYEDIEAREEVVCSAYGALRGMDVDQVDFQNAWDDESGDSEFLAIMRACRIMAQENASYVAFIEALEYGFNASGLGLLPGCACETELFVYEIDFASGDLGVYEILVGTQVAGGVKGIDIGVGFYLARVQMSIPHDMILHEIEMEYTRTDGSTSVDDKHVVSSWPDQEQSGTRIEWLGASGLNNGLRVECTSNATGRIARVVRFDATVNDTPTGEIIIHRVKIVVGSPAPLGQIDEDYELCP